MKPNERRGRTVRVLLLSTVSVAIAVGSVAIAAGPCEQLCQAQYAEDFSVCADAHQQALAEARADREQCVEQATGLLDYLRCENAYASARARADLERARCVQDAQTNLAQCLLDCTQSPAEP